MHRLRERKTLALIVMGIFLIGISLFLYVIQRSTDDRTRAAAASHLTFEPRSTISTPLQKNVNDEVSLDVRVNPGTNLVGTVRVIISYDSTKLGPPDGGAIFTPNTTTFPRILQAPVYSAGKIGVSLSIGTSVDSVVKTPQSVGTLRLKTIAPTTGAPTMITFDSSSAIYSAGEDAQFAENVLSSTTPAFIAVAGPTPTPVPGDPSLSCSPQTLELSDFGKSVQVTLTDDTNTPMPNKTISWSSTSGISLTGTSSVTNTSGIAQMSALISLNTPVTNGKITATYSENNKNFTCQITVNSNHPTPPTATPTNSPTPTFTPTPTLTPTASPTPKGTAFQLTVAMHGIGSSGDNKTPETHSLSNKNPLHKERPFTFELFNTNNVKVSTLPGLLLYNETTGLFDGSVDGGFSIPPGQYAFRVKVPGLLGRTIQEFRNVKIEQVNVLSSAQKPVTLVTGDLDDDNKLSILDYNIIAFCFHPARPASECTLTPHGDLNDDGMVNEFDHNLWLRELSVYYSD